MLNPSLDLYAGPDRA